MKEVLTQAEKLQQPLEFSALVLKCTPEGSIKEILHTDFGNNFFIPSEESFANLFCGISQAHAQDFLA
jgi:hypothetical protein